MILIAVLCALFVFQVRPVQACSVAINPVGIIDQSHDLIVVVSVVGASDARFHTADQPVWNARGRVNLIVENNANEKPMSSSYAFGRSGGSAACSDNLSRPLIGEEWVLYITYLDDGSLRIWSYPAAFAHKVDARFKRKK